MLSVSHLRKPPRQRCKRMSEKLSSSCSRPVLGHRQKAHLASPVGATSGHKL